MDLKRIMHVNSDHKDHTLLIRETKQHIFSKKSKTNLLRQCSELNSGPYYKSKNVNI